MSENFKTYFLDIMSVMLPGGLFILILFQGHSQYAEFLNALKLPNISWIKEGVYLGASYCAGHFIFFLGSSLDGFVYDKAKMIFWSDKELLSRVVALKEKQSGIVDAEVLNAFKWSCAWLLMHKPESHELTERYVAESKFFRSMVVVMGIGAIIFFRQNDNTELLICILIAPLALTRYLTQRHKSIETAYQHVIIANGNALDSPTPQPQKKEVPATVIKKSEYLWVTITE